MKIAVRMDDITPDMDWERFLAFKGLLDEYGVKPLLGVVPDNQDENLHRAKAAGDFWEYISELQKEGFCIALHGYQHLYTTKKGGIFPLNKFSEFAGLPLAEQREMIQKGTQILIQNGIHTDIFMAPAHSYDKNTLLALKEAGYTKITDGFGNKPYEWQGMKFYPISFMLSRSLKKKRGITTMVVHANEMTTEELAGYRKLFEEHQSELISYGDYLNEPCMKRGIWGRLVERMLAGTKRRLVKLKAGRHQ